MADVFTKSERSAIMARVKGRQNLSTELRLVHLMRRHRIRGWRRGLPLCGKPDFIFREQRLAIFVDGCFWHGCPRCYRRPKSRRKYWDAKVDGNISRDRRNRARLRRMGWRVLRIWEHELVTSPMKCVRKLQRKLIAKR
jgi:DNA mismatch endonuclease (patch repair protein)